MDSLFAYPVKMGVDILCKFYKLRNFYNYFNFFISENTRGEILAQLLKNMPLESSLIDAEIQKWVIGADNGFQSITEPYRGLSVDLVVF